MTFNKQLNIKYLTYRSKGKQHKDIPLRYFGIFFSSQTISGIPMVLHQDEPLSEKVLTHSGGNDRKHAFRKELCNIIGRLIYRLEISFF